MLAENRSYLIQTATEKCAGPWTVNAYFAFVSGGGFAIQPDSRGCIMPGLL